MALEYTLDSLDGVEESLHGAYVQDGDKYNFDPDKYAELKAAGLKTNQAALKKEKEKLKADFENFKKKFADLADDDELQKFRDWRERQTLGGEGEGDDGKGKEDLALKLQNQLKAERQKWNTEKQTELAAKEQETARWKDAWKRERLGNKLREFALGAGVFKEDLETFVELILYKRHFDLSGDDDAAEVVFLQDGEPSAIPPDKAMAETLKEKYGRFYESPTQGGSGAQNAGKGGPRGVDWKKLSPIERLNHARTRTKAHA